MESIFHSEQSNKAKSYFPFHESKPNSYAAAHLGLSAVGQQLLEALSVGFCNGCMEGCELDMNKKYALDFSSNICPNTQTSQTSQKRVLPSFGVCAVVTGWWSRGIDILLMYPSAQLKAGLSGQ